MMIQLLLGLSLKNMKQETLRYLAMAILYSLALFGCAFLVGCSVPAKYIVDCTFVQPRNCN